MRFVRYAIAGMAIFAACAALNACAPFSSSSTVADSNQVAATVNGVEILESTVESRIGTIRASSGSFTDDEGWDSYLSSTGYDATSYREKVLDELVDNEVIRQAAKTAGISADDEEVDERIESQKSAYSDDASWNAALSAAGLDEDAYRDKVVVALLTEKLIAQEVQTPVATDDQIQDYFDEHAASYAGRRSAHILLSGEDRDHAVDVLSQVDASNNPQAAFALFAEEYSQDRTTATNGGDMGWESLNVPGSTYKTALDQLEVGEVSKLVRDDYGYHIIICTGIFKPSMSGGHIDVSSVPDEISEVLLERLNSQLEDDAVNTYIQKLHDDADIAIYDADGNAV